MKKMFLALALAIMGLVSCATVPKEEPVVAPVTAAPIPLDLSELFGAKSVNLPVDYDPNSVHLVGRVTFNVPVDEGSVNSAISWIEAADRDGLFGLVLEFNTPGGSVDDGRRLSRAIESAATPIYCVVDGDAASMGMYLLQSCPIRMMTKRSVLMAHDPSSGMRGREQEFLDAAHMLGALGDALGEHVCHRMKIPGKECRAHFRGKEWWIGWEEALEVGAVDRIAPSPDLVVDELRKNGRLPLPIH